MELLLSMAQYVEDADDTFQPELLLEIFHQVQRSPWRATDPTGQLERPLLPRAIP